MYVYQYMNSYICICRYIYIHMYTYTYTYTFTYTYTYVQALLEEGAQVDATLPAVTTLTSGATALHLASCGGWVESVRVLVEYGAAVDVRDEQGWTPLVYADFMRNRDCVVALLQPHKTEVCANQLKMLGELLQTDRGETRERVVKVCCVCMYSERGGWGG